MIHVLDADQMRAADHETITGLGLPSLVLMESAAWAVTDALLDNFANVETVTVVCGPGNNGGDGLAVARQLRCRGVAVEVALAVAPESLSGDASVQLGLVRAFGVPVRPCDDDLGGLQASLGRAAVVVDALFGTGLDRPLAGRFADVVRLINTSGAPVLAVDIPSGLAGSRSSILGESVAAQLTVTFAAPKVAHALPPACWRCGELAVADIGIPPWVIRDRSHIALVEALDVAGWLPERGVDAHKGHFGHLGVVAGRFGRAGAAALAARAAVVTGAGLVTVGIPRSGSAAIQGTVPEAMVDELGEDAEGSPTPAGLDALLARVTAVALGPGIGCRSGARALVERLLGAWSGPLLIDADGINVLAGRPEALHGRPGPTLLTPHPGEMARLLGVPVTEVLDDRVGAAREAARRSGAAVLLKGPRTVIAAPQRTLLVNPTGTPGLASGGAGDTLTGVCGALLACGLGAQEAGAAGAYLHGRAAELAGETYPAAVPASALATFLAAAMREVGATL